jgi:DNA-binding MarR family transcriptional regulator
MPQSLHEISLDEILSDPRVKAAIQKRTWKLTQMNLDRAAAYANQITSCHAWLLTLHYRSINRLREKYKITTPQFIVLLAAYFLRKTGNGLFKVKDSLNLLLDWQHGRVYNHMKALSEKGYINIHRNPYNKTNYYSMTREGETVVRAFSQHFRKCVDDVWEYFGKFPNEFWY